MKKSYMLILLLSLAYFPLNAQSDSDAKDSDLIIKITPSATAEGRLYFSGKEQRKGETITTDGDAEARLKAEADYKGIFGGIIEVEGAFSSISSDAASLRFGDNAYAYVHILKVFGFDDKLFDIYLRGGRFETEFQNAQYGGDDDWRADVSALSRYDKINMQVDFKLLDMLTLRYAFGFHPFERREVNDLVALGPTDKRTRLDLSERLDMGAGLLFEKSFGIHKIQASLGYSVDVSPNNGDFEDSNSTAINQSNFAKEGSPADFDQLGISFGYTATFGRITLAPFANLTLSSIFHKPHGSYDSPLWSWSAGSKFSYQDVTNDYDIIGIGLDLDGSIRANNNFRASDGTESQSIDYVADKGFTGIQVKVWSDVLKSIMGERYLSFWGKQRFEFWTPEIDIAGEPLKRVSVVTAWGLGVAQHIVNKEDATVKIKAEFSLENLAPFSAKGSGFYSGLDASESFQGPRQDQLLKLYIDVALEASFTSTFGLNLSKKK